MHEFFSILRWLHVFAGAIWLGQLVLVNAVLFPVIMKMDESKRGMLMGSLMPKMLKFALHISLTTVITGLLVIHHYMGPGAVMLMSIGWGLPIITGGLIAIILTINNIIMYRKISKVMAAHSDSGSTAPPQLPKPIISPPMGLILVTIIFLLMLIASHPI